MTAWVLIFTLVNGMTMNSGTSNAMPDLAACLLIGSHVMANDAKKSEPAIVSFECVEVSK